MVLRTIRLTIAITISVFFTNSFASHGGGSASSQENAAQVKILPCKTSIYSIYQIEDPKRSEIVGNAVAVSKHVLATHCRTGMANADIIAGVDEKSTYTYVQAYDANKELCLLNVPSRELKPAKLRPTKDVKVEEKVYKIGSPQGIRLILSIGKVDAITQADKMPVLETSAAMSDEEFGAGIFDKDCNLIGIAYLDPKHSGKTLALSTELINETLQKKPV